MTSHHQRAQSLKVDLTFRTQFITILRYQRCEISEKSKIIARGGCRWRWGECAMRSQWGGRGVFCVCLLVTVGEVN